MILLLSIRELIRIQFTSLFNLIAENLLCKIAKNRNSPIFRAMKFAQKRSTTKEKICAFFHKNCAKVVRMETILSQYKGGLKVSPVHGF